LDQFSTLFFEIREFSPFNQILLSLFDISSTFHNSIWLNIKVKMCQRVQTTQIQSWNAFETSNKSNKIWLKLLNPRISKDEGLNWSKVSKWTNSKIHWKLRDQKYI